MKLLVQRVLSAHVEVNQQIVGQIQKGMLVFLGVEKGDTKQQAEFFPLPRLPLVHHQPFLYVPRADVFQKAKVPFESFLAYLPKHHGACRIQKGEHTAQRYAQPKQIFQQQHRRRTHTRPAQQGKNVYRRPYSVPVPELPDLRIVVYLHAIFVFPR